MFSYTDKVTRKLAEQKYWPLLEDAIPAHSSAAIIRCVYKRLLILRQLLLDVFEPAEPSSTIDGPAGQTHSRQTTSSLMLVFNTAIGAVLPDKAAFKDDYVANLECRMILDLIVNPSLVVKANLSKIHSSYRGLLCCGLIILQKGLIQLTDAAKCATQFMEYSLYCLPCQPNWRPCWPE